MTELAAKSGVYLWYRYRIEPVYTRFVAAAVLIGLAVPALAQANDALAEFETRCLIPIIEMRRGDTTGLHLIEDMGARETWVGAGQDWHLSRAAADAPGQYCAIHGTVTPRVDDWTAAAIASGDWERIERVPETLQSVFTRAPLLEIEIDRAGESLTVIKTDLEG